MAAPRTVCSSAQKQTSAHPPDRSQMGSKVVTLLVLVLVALVSAREDCACALSSCELQRKVAAADHAAIAKYEARSKSSKASTMIQGSLEAQLVLQHVGWLASQPSKEHAKPSTRALMGQMEEVGAGAGAGGLQHLELPPHDAELVPVELMEAEHASSGPWTTPGSTIAEVDYTKPFNCRSRLTASAREDPRVQEVSLGSRASALHKTQHRRAQGWRVGRGRSAPRV